MIKKVNPRVAMFDALQVTEELFDPAQFPVIRRFLSLTTAAPIINTNGPTGLKIRYRFKDYFVKPLEVLVKNRASAELQVLEPGEFSRLFYDFGIAESEINKLASFISARFPEILGREFTSSLYAAV